MELNREEKKQDFYDNYFNKDKEVNCHYSRSPYYCIWKELISEIPNERILEVGCGTGQLGHMLYDFGYKKYVGFDFSPVAIKIAKKMCDKQKYFVGNAYDKKNYYDYDIILSTEVFEHLDDIKILNNIKKGKKMFLTLPRLDTEAHIRRFENRQSIHKRYENYIDLKIIKYREKRYWLVWGEKK